MDLVSIRNLLERKVTEYNNERFIARDPVCVPHRFSLKQDIEISAFFAATFAWGNRTTIIHKTNELIALMDNSPYAFIQNHRESDLKRFLPFVHRTFNAHDVLYFIRFLAFHYKENDSLETAFVSNKKDSMKEKLIYFQKYFFSLEHLKRTEKHISTPAKNSACKRLNMFLRWMVRNDNAGVDFGIWKNIQMNELVCPLDIHVCNVAYRLGLLENAKSNWKNAELLTNVFREFDSNDPVKYDFALFALGVEERFR